MEAEYTWDDVAYLHATDESLAIYESLMPILTRNPYFLYNYAVTLLDVDCLDESLDKALQCNLDLDNRMVYEKFLKGVSLTPAFIIEPMDEEYEISERHYKKASCMCPCRFMPLYRMFELYKEVGDREHSQSMAQLIIEKPIKVRSSMIRQIKYKVKQELQ